jgi:hypothetical protein
MTRPQVSFYMQGNWQELDMLRERDDSILLSEPSTEGGCLSSH